MKFVKTDNNPKGKKCGDCVVRAIASASNKKWIDVYDGLCELGRTISCMPNSKETYEKYLIGNGWTKNKMPKKADGRKYRVRDLPELLKLKERQSVVVAVSSHLTCVEGDNLVDTWDCSSKSVLNYYTR